MDRNSIIGLLLIMGILVGYGIWMNPSKEELDRQKFVQDSIATAEAKLKTQTTHTDVKTISSPDSMLSTVGSDSLVVTKQNLALEAKYGVLANAAVGTELENRLETDKFIITFSNKGGRIKNIELKGHKTWGGKPVQLFDPKSALFGFELPIIGKGDLNTQNFYFTPTTIPDKIAGSEKTILAYRLSTNTPGQYLELVYTIHGDSYLIDFQINTRNLDQVLDNSKKLALHWKINGNSNEKSLLIERQRSSVFYKTVDDDRDYLSETSDEDEETMEQATNWVAFKQYFFSAAVISKEGFPAANSKLKIVTPKDSATNKVYEAHLTLPMASIANGSSGFQFYFGPNELKTLQATGIDQFDRIIDYGWGIFGIVNKYFIWYLFQGLNWLSLGVGITILLLTIAIKMLLMPLTYKNYQSSAKMRILKPEVDAINEKFKNADPMKKQQEMMSLYRQTGVNPLAGCIPVLIQMPFLYAMFRFFPASMELRHKAFLWADDLSSFDSILDLGVNIPMYGSHVSLFTILMCISTFVYTRMNNANMPAPQPGMPDMRIIMNIFPFMMLLFFNSYSSGLSYYYFAANVVTMAQTIIIRKYFVDEQKILTKIEENKKKPAGKSKLQQRMEDMAKKRGVKLPK